MSFDLKRHNQRLLSLTIPLVIEQFLRISMGNINIFLLGSYTDDAVAAVGVANQFINMGQMLLTLAATGASVVISQYLGANDPRRANASALVTLLLSLAMGCIVCPVLALFPTFFLGLMGMEAKLLPDAVSYLRIIGGTLFLHGLFAVFSSICRCYRKPRIPMYGIVLMNVLNILGTSWAVYGHPPAGLDVVSAVAWANALSTLAGLALLVAGTVHSIPISYSPRLLRPFPLSLAGEVLRIGLPGGIESVSYNISQILTTAMITGLGVVTLSAKTYLNSIVVYIYVLGMCFGQASQLIVAQLAGAGELDEASAFVKRNIRYNLALNLGISMLVILVRRPLLGLFTENAQVIGLVSRVMFIDLLIQGGRAFNHCFNVALRAVGDVRFTMLLMLLSTWIVSVPMSYLLAVRLGLGLYGIWGAFAMDECLRGGVACWRWCAGKWRPGMLRRLEVIQREAKETSA